MSKNQVSIADIYTEYVRMRQSGWPAEDVVRQLKSQADELSVSERLQLVDLIRGWETRDGQRYGSTEEDTQAQPPTQATQQAEPAAKPTIRRISKASEKKACPNCGKLNNKKDSYCYACGHILEAPRTSTKSLEEDLDGSTRWGTAHFGQFSTLVLQIRGVEEPLEVTPQGEMILGRGDKDSAIQPDIDLGPYRAEDLGVSRLHAQVKRHENTVAISDLNSKNFTFINGQKVHPNEVRALRDGDELRLGRLMMRVTFKRQVRRIQDR